MSVKVFVGGSRSLTALDGNVIAWLNTLMSNDVEFLVGDADGIDIAVQQFLVNSGYDNFKVYCTGSTPRHCLAEWSCHIPPPPDTTPTQREYYLAKDRAMALDADAGMMVWDHESIGTLMNVQRLTEQGKECLVWAKHVSCRFSDNTAFWEFAAALPSRIQEQIRKA